MIPAAVVTVDNSDRDPDIVQEQEIETDLNLLEVKIVWLKLNNGWKI